MARVFCCLASEQYRYRVRGRGVSRDWEAFGA
jgi:hypothetical protein